MVSRLVLGCSRLGHQFVDELRGWPGDLHVLEPDDDRVKTLRTEKIDAERADVTDVEAIRAAGPADVVVVAGDDPQTNLAALRAAATALPDAYLLATPGDDVDRETRRQLAERADRVIDPGEAVIGHVLDLIEHEDARRLRELREVLADVDGTLGVFTHDNPDPDAIASGLALVRIAESVGTEAELCHYGEVAHQENRAFVNLLEIPLRDLDGEAAVEYDGIGLVDHAQPGINDGLPPDTEVDVVIDHHPTPEGVGARFVDLRESVGATSTLLTGYYRHSSLSIEEAVATGLLYGIRIDTSDFSRETNVVDLEAAAYLLPRADTEVLERVESPNVAPETLDKIADAIRNRRVEGNTLASGVGTIPDRDVLAQAADRLLDLQNIQNTLVFGHQDDMLYLSARSSDPELDLGAVLRDAFEDLGSAGGHAGMAGAQLPLGLFGEVSEDDHPSFVEMVVDAVADRFFAAIEAAHEGSTGQPAEATSAPPVSSSFEEPSPDEDGSDDGGDEQSGGRNGDGASTDDAV